MASRSTSMPPPWRCRIRSHRRHRRLVGIYRWTGASWAREARIPGTAVPDALGSRFGSALDLSRTGNMLAIGDASLREGGRACRPSRCPAPRIAARSTYGGATIATPQHGSCARWSSRRIRARRCFGISIAMCGTGHALAVGAEGEDSKAKGVDGDRTDNSSTDSGAAYLYSTHRSARRGCAYPRILSPRKAPA